MLSDVTKMINTNDWLGIKAPPPFLVGLGLLVVLTGVSVDFGLLVVLIGALVLEAGLLVVLPGILVVKLGPGLTVLVLVVLVGSIIFPENMQSINNL